VRSAKLRLTTAGASRKDNRMIKDFDEFVRFCLEHGEKLRYHRNFGEMARDLRLQIEQFEKAVEQINPNTCPYCKGSGKGKMNGVEVGCIMCRKTGKIRTA